ncbi:dienelactone hydrolase family protein [Actinoplanes couchii]|nr:dienelactone hydrolase family protein [Actinoplanes couchii]MDR6317580.1 carboxymethylenebutenolidase [Actinoplanes couchii]
MKLTESDVRIGDIRTTVIRPATGGSWPGLLLYTDIFQRTESTLRTARRLAGAGFLVAVPEIYPHGNLGGVALEFDDAGKQRGLEGAATTSVAGFDADRLAVLDHLSDRDDVDRIFVTGFCIGGHLAFRAAFDSRVEATICFYPTGLHNGALGKDADAGSLQRAGEIQGRLMIVFGSQDPHVPADARLAILQRLYAEGLTDLELHVFTGGEHAFMRDVGPRHDPILTDHAIIEATRFLNES